MLFSRRLLRALPVAISLTLYACADTPANEAASITSSADPAQQDVVMLPSTPLAAPAAIDQPATPALDFPAWLQQFRAKALQSGVSATLFDQAFAGVTPDAAVIKADYSQPEFSRPVWEYLDGAVSTPRIRSGQTLLTSERQTLESIERHYGVERQTLVAIWGLESNFGQFMGDRSVIRSLATLAHEGRRPAFAEQQLLAALQILASGDTSLAGLRGSWAGAMGQTQFIPTTYLSHAVDFDGDGRRDIWNSRADALASAAHYLQASGWQAGQPWGLEVALPDGFDYALADEAVRKPLAEWTDYGVKMRLPAGVDMQAPSYLLLPAGHRGPAFITLPNFRAILAYNNSSSYALAVGLLGDSFNGGGKVDKAWPRADLPLSRSERIELQERLELLGYRPGVADSIIGANTRRAIRAFQRDQALPADGYASKPLLEALRASKRTEI